MQFYSDGVPVAQIARRLKVHRNRVYEILRAVMKGRVFGSNAELTKALSLLRRAGIDDVPAIRHAIQTGAIHHVRNFSVVRINAVKKWLNSKPATPSRAFR